jgi:hypothetical protein
VSLKIASIFALAAEFSGCRISTIASGPVQYDSRVIERDASDSAHVTLNIGAGDLKVSSGTEKFMRAYFTYNVPQFKPDVRYSTSGGVANLSIDQPNSHGRIGHNKYEWDVRLNNEIPIELDVHFGAGQAQLDLGSLALRRVNVEMGVGQMQMDLRGAPKHDYTVSVQGGVGEAEVKLPGSVGIEATASGGIGDISVRGLTKEGGRWVNDAFHGSGVKVRVNVQGGVGAIHITAE